MAEGGSVDVQVESISSFRKEKLTVELESTLDNMQKEKATEVKKISNPMSSEEVEKYAMVNPDHGRKITIDNIDIHIPTHDMTEDHQNLDAHYCSWMSTENRVSGLHLPDEEPICKLETVENGTFCPTQLDHKKQRQNYCDLVGRIVTDSLPCLSELKDVAVKHTPHQYSKEMKEATDTVSENQL